MLSTFGVFCGRLADYAQVNFENATGSPYVNLRYVSGPSPTPETAATFSAGCPMPSDLATTWELGAGETAYMLLRPGMYEFNVAYPQPQPGVANSLFVVIPAGANQTIQLHDDGATSNNAETQIVFPGRERKSSPARQHPPAAWLQRQTPEGVTLTNGDLSATALPSRIVQIDGLKLEQLPPKGPGVQLMGVANDPEGSQLLPFWTMSGGANQYTLAGAAVASGASIANQFTFQPTVAGDYTVYLTVYDDKGLFRRVSLGHQRASQCQAGDQGVVGPHGGRVWAAGRWGQSARGRTGYVPLATAMRPGAAVPLVVPSLITPAESVIWDGLTLCLGASGAVRRAAARRQCCNRRTGAR